MRIVESGHGNPRSEGTRSAAKWSVGGFSVLQCKSSVESCLGKVLAKHGDGRGRPGLKTKAHFRAVDFNGGLGSQLAVH